jgi:DNA replication and repair protein RecF
MHIKKLTLLNFRSHCNLQIDNLSSFIQIIGPNGSGKTNILEAISLLAPGRGLHKGDFSDMLSRNQSIYRDWSVRADIEADCHISTGAIPIDSGSKRVSYINGEKVKNQAELLQVLRIIWLTPQMDDIFISPASNRRRFLDRITYNFHPDHAANSAKYDYFMRSRLKLLMSDSYDKMWLSQLEAKMAQYARSIFELRNSALEIIRSFLASEKSAFISPILHMEEGGDAMDEEDILRALHNNRGMDGLRGRSHFGPHRSDLIAWHPNKNIKASQCSTGEQKAMLVSLMLAQAKGLKKHCNHPPVVLLDELFTHLDLSVQKKLLESLKEFQCQIWSTATEHVFGLDGETVIKF